MKLPKLHLRDLFWLVLVCALAVGWLVDRRAVQATREREVREAFKLADDIANACQDEGYIIHLPPDGGARLVRGKMP